MSTTSFKRLETIQTLLSQPGSNPRGIVVY